MTRAALTQAVRRLALLALGAAWALPAGAGTSPQAQRALQALEAAEVSYDRQQLQTTIDQLERLLAQEPQNAEYAYLLARAHFPLINLYDWAGERRRAQEAGAKGIAHLEAALKAGGDANTDAYRLLGDFYGRLSFFQGIFGRMRYGGRSTNYHKKAFERTPDDYRTIIGLATDKLYAPSAFGGDVPAAVELFKKAIATDPQAPAGYLWLAKAYLKQGQVEWAREQFAKAQQVAPGSGLVAGEWQAAAKEYPALGAVRTSQR